MVIFLFLLFPFCHFLIDSFFTLEIPVIRSAEYKLTIIREICICMFSLYIKMKSFKEKKLGILQELGGIGISALESKSIVMQIMKICIRSTHYIFIRETGTGLVQNNENFEVAFLKAVRVDYHAIFWTVVVKINFRYNVAL